MNLVHDFAARRLYRPLLSFGLGAACLAGVAGCGSSDAPARVDVFEVQGKVLLSDGKPLSGGSIFFVPVKDSLIIPNGKINQDGTFSLSTGDSGAGAPPGEYKVRIEPQDPAVMLTKRPGAPARKPFPPKYWDEDSSELKVTVRAEPNHLEPFRLK
jgi:hypothetical protein